MLVNLHSTIDSDINKVMSQFLTYNSWKKLSESFLQSCDGSFVLSFFPEILTYSEKENDKLVLCSHVWIGCRFTLDSQDDHELACKEFLKHLLKLQYKPFEDPSAKYNIFSVKRSGMLTDYVCYFNPDMPNGTKRENVL